MATDTADLKQHAAESVRRFACQKVLRSRLDLFLALNEDHPAKASDHVRDAWAAGTVEALLVALTAEK